MLARCPQCPQCPHRKCAGFAGTLRACRSGGRSNGCGCQHLCQLTAPAAARHLRRVAVHWPAGSRPRPRHLVACTKTGRSVVGFHQQDGYRRQCAGVAVSAPNSGFAFVSFWVVFSFLSVAPGRRFVVAGVKWSDKCFCPYRTPGRCGNYKGHGTPLPFCAEVFLLAAAARGIGTDGDCCCKSVHRVEPSIPWPWVRQIAHRLTWPAGSRRVQIALHGLRRGRAVSQSLGAFACASRRQSLLAGAICASSQLAHAAW